MSKQNQPSRTLYIANFPKDTQKHHLQQLFSPYGKIANLAIVNKQKFSFAFADFENIEDAIRIQQKFDQKPYREMNMKVSFRQKRENGHTSYHKPIQYSTPDTFNGQLKGTHHSQKNSFNRNYTSRKPNDKDQRRSDSQSSRSRKNSIDRGIPRERSRSKGFRRKRSSQQSSGRHEIKRRLTDNRGKSDSKDNGHIKGRLSQKVSREDSKKILNLQKQIVQLSKEVDYLTKRLSRVENQFIDVYNKREYSKRR